jgi:hypothetical protein
MLQHCAHGCGQGVCHQGNGSSTVGVSKHGGLRKTGLTLFKVLTEGWYPGDGLRAFGTWAGKKGV